MKDEPKSKKKPYSKPAIEFEKRVEALAVNCNGSPGNKQSPGAADITGGVCETINT